jgi:hypothetical protein
MEANNYVDLWTQSFDLKRGKIRQEGKRTMFDDFLNVTNCDENKL